MKCSRVAFLSFVFAVAGAGVALAQAANSPAPSAQAPVTQFDIGGSVYEAFTGNTTGNGTQQTATNEMGGMFEARYLMSRFRGFGVTFSYNPAHDTFTPNGTSYSTCGLECANPTRPLVSKVSQFGMEWVPSVTYGKLRPFAVVGFGFLITFPSNSIYLDVNTVIRPVYVFGGGADYSLTPHFGVRAQYRYNLFKAPNIETLYNATGVFTHYSEPMGGVFYRF